jgi:hypothetical protein
MKRKNINRNRKKEGTKKRTDVHENRKPKWMPCPVGKKEKTIDKEKGLLRDEGDG